MANNPLREHLIPFLARFVDLGSELLPWRKVWTQDFEATGTVTVPTPTGNTDAATKAYVDAAISGQLLVEELDGNPSISTLTLKFDQADGFVVTEPGANEAQVNLDTSLFGTIGVTAGTGLTGGDATLALGDSTSLALDTPVAVANGGTGAGTAAGARTNLDAAQTSHSHAAGDITSGTMATARLGSGSATSSTFLRGDQTWQALSALLPFHLTPVNATFPTSNFPELKKNVGTNWVDYTLDFDQATTETAYWSFAIPTDASFTTATIEIWSRQPAVTSGTVGWKITTLTRADDEAWDTAGNTDTATAENVSSAAGDVQRISKALTTTGWAAGEWLLIAIVRDIANDDAAEDAKFMGAVLRLT